MCTVRELWVCCDVGNHARRGTETVVYSHGVHSQIAMEAKRLPNPPQGSGTCYTQCLIVGLE
jgi:hypothetical protein